MLDNCSLQNAEAFPVNLCKAEKKNRKGITNYPTKAEEEHIN